MREMKRFLTVCLCVMLVTTLMIPETAFASRTAASSSRKSAEAVVRTGWYTQKNGKKKYYRDNLTVFYNYKKSGNRIIQEDIWKHDKKRHYD